MRIAILEISHWHVPLYLPAFTELGITPVAVSDEQPGYAERFAGQYSGCTPYVDYVELLEKEKLDFVFSFGRYRLQPEIATQLLERRIPFVIEKPLGTDASQFERLIALAKQNDVFVAIPLTNRAAPFSQTVKDMRDSGRLGQIRHAHFRYAGGPVQRYVDSGCPWMLDVKECGGGALRNLGIHYTDLFHWLTGSRQVQVASTQLQRITPGIPVEEYANIGLYGDDNAYATIEVAYTFPADSSDTVWNVSDGQTYVTYRDGATCIFTKDGVEERGGHTVQGLYQDFVGDTLQAYREGGEPLATLEDMHRAMVVVDACYEKADE
ncbi:MAG: Gfo/Idh/MocA family oxidoreductase [Chloroflexota bacterium]|nr:Gfo/Idh/MocA family oxidoreductase [Chloroflexota bacterium]MDE2839332.1 Gfo/Idh/MocA family oxidoreductase [Chloroflexota bacterium]MDE2930984.1 Gfo/Idh/MocA family oxidoreductase [Chloroflexota bacterium]